MKKNTKKTLLISGFLLLVLLLTSCSTQNFTLQNRSANTKLTEAKSQAFFIAGLGQTATINAAKICRGAENVAKVETVDTGLDYFLSLITIGIYTPRTVEVYCRLQS